MSLDPAKVAHAAQQGIPLVITSHTLPASTEVDLETILASFLAALGQSELLGHLSYCLRELTGNAKKANTKRVYFLSRGLDIEKPADYELGMKTFKSDTLNDIATYLALQVEHDLYIKVGFLVRNHTLHLSVRNNARLTTTEMTRAFDRMARSRAFSSMEEAFLEVLDDSEGAGLGITILVLMLRKMGLTEKCFHLAQGDKETIASLTIPMDGVRLEKVVELSQEMIGAVESLPPFPENLTQLIRLLDDPEVSMDSLAATLGRDPALTADLMRFLNSAGAGQRRRVDSLQEAVRIVGIRALKDLTYGFGAHKLLEGYLAQQKSLWDNAVRVSAYAAEAARTLGLDRGSQGLAEIAGLLYNLGQIVVSYLHPAQSSRILAFCRERGLSVELFDDLTHAINPTDVAGRIAQKWNFPPDLIEVLRLQNQPPSAPADLQPVTSVVHLAASLLWVEQDLLHYSQINAQVVKHLKLHEPMALEALHGRLKTRVEQNAG